MFDTRLLVDHLDELYVKMWAEYQSGKLPQPEIVNLDVYQDVGIEEDIDLRTPLTMDEYNRRYLRRLAYRNSLYPLPNDHRLWTSEAAKRAAF